MNVIDASVFKSVNRPPTTEIPLVGTDAVLPIDDALQLDPSDARVAERADAVANRKRILEVAERLFADLGVANVNMIDIAKAAEVGQGTLYRRFANKGALCLTLLDVQMRDFQERVFAQLRQMAAQRIGPVDQLAWFLNALCLFQDRHAPLLLEVPIQPRNDVAAWRWQEITVNGLLGSAERAGQLRPGLDVVMAAELLMSSLNPMLFTRLRLGRGFSPQRISDGLQQLLQALRV